MAAFQNLTIDARLGLGTAYRLIPLAVCPGFALRLPVRGGSA